MPTQWYALQSKPMKETLLGEQLILHGMEGYYPCIRTHPVNPRARKSKPYFPGYIFGRLDLEQINLSVLHWLPGAVGIVSFGGVPSLVPDHLILAIQRRVDEINRAGGEVLKGLKVGDPVKIQEGPFRGYEALFNARLSGDERVRVLLKLLNKTQVSVELPTSFIHRKTQ